jgi:hypothetical protein
VKKIIIEVRNVYGQNKAYPACMDAKCFADMLGTKTLTRIALCHIVALGYDIEVRASCPGLTFAVTVTKVSDLPAVQ